MSSGEAPNRSRRRELNFSLSGLLSFDLHGKPAAINGTGKSGSITPHQAFLTHEALSDISQALLSTLHATNTHSLSHPQNLQSITTMKANATRKAHPTIICGTDFTPAARNAADTASAIARCLACRLELVHATSLPSYAPIQEQLRSEATRLRDQGADVHESVIEGNPDEELVKRAKPGCCRMLVVASLGKRAPQRWLLGSVSERTAERALVPTLIVRNSEPFLAWTQGRHPLQVFIAFNFTPTSEAALRWAGNLLAMGRCEVLVGYVDDRTQSMSHPDHAGLQLSLSPPPETATILEHDLKAKVIEVLGTTDFKIRIETNYGRPALALAAMANEAGAGLVVIGSHQYQGFEKLWNTSVSKGLLHAATMNVVVVPVTPATEKPAPSAPAVERVLVTTDFSARANRALTHACAMLRGGGTVRLIHIIHPHELANGEFLHGHVDQRFKTRHAKHIKACLKKLTDLIQANATGSNILTEVEVIEHCDVALGILQAAERFDAHAICIASHGHTGLKSVILGSVAKKLLSTSRRPLYLVRVTGD
jgi:nucleotide-binding universal stress UspA family protein